MERIKVVARIRPMLATETSRNDEVVTHISANNTNITLESKALTNMSKSYKLDKIIDQEGTQDDVFGHVSPMLDDLLAGYSCSLFTYGQTGTGNPKQIFTVKFHPQMLCYFIYYLNFLQSDIYGLVMSETFLH